MEEDEKKPGIPDIFGYQERAKEIYREATKPLMAPIKEFRRKQAEEVAGMLRRAAMAQVATGSLLNIEDILRGFYRLEEKPAPVEPQIVIATREQLIRELSKSPSDLHKLSPREFEEFVAEMLVRMGFVNVQLTKQTRDGGYDIMCYSSNVLGGLMHLVECKRYASDKHVGVSVVRELGYVVDKVKANQGIIVTTSGFSSDALKEAREIKRIETKDMEFIAKWLAEYGEGYHS